MATAWLYPQPASVKSESENYNEFYHFCASYLILLNFIFHFVLR